MKKIYSLITLCFIVAATFVSCSDDDDVNTAVATVAFGEQTYSVKENKGLFTIPVVVEGELNGPVIVDVEVSANSPECKEDVNYFVTSKHITINPAKKSSYVEIKTIDDRNINADRQFTLTIVKAEGAQISSTLASANITLRDNDDIPYERMAGKWTATAFSLDTESNISFDMDFITVDDETDPSYGTLITAQPWAIFNGEQPIFDEEGKCLVHPFTFHHDEKTGKTTVDMRMGTIMAGDIDFGYDSENKVDLSKASIRSATDGMTGPAYSGTITGDVNDDFTEVKFRNRLYLIVFATNGQPYMYYGAFDNLTFKLKK